MPNHVTTIITFSGSAESVNNLLESIKGENGAIDFESVSPMPEIFRKYDTTNHPHGAGLKVGEKMNPWDKDSPIVTEELIEEYKRATNEQWALYGVIGWYHWHCDHWGTKWNAYDIVQDGNTLTFDTAWSAPLPIFRRLAELFPSVGFHAIYADEDAGCNTGELVYDGDGRGICESYPADDTDESWELYFATHDYATDYYQKVDGHWRYVEDED